MTGDSTLPPSLAAVGRVVIEDAKMIRGWGKRIQACILAIGVFAVLVQTAPTLIDALQKLPSLTLVSKAVAYGCALTALVLQVVRWWLQRVAADRHSLGSTIKRRALLIESLGPSSEQLDIRLLRDLAGATAEARAKKYEMPKSYYASKHEPGMERLRENLQESAFFSHSLYRKAAARGFFKFGITFGCIVAALLVVAGLVPREAGLIVANCILAFIAFLVSADQLGQAMSWNAAAHAIERIERRLENIASNSSEPYMAAFADYEAATATAPPAPTALYEKERQRLDALWRNRTGQ